MPSLKHVVPYISASRRVQGPVNSVNLHQILHRIKKQLNVDDDFDNGVLGENELENTTIPLLVFSDKVLKKQEIPKYTPIRKFSFNNEDFPISATKLKYAPSEFPESRYPIVKKDTPICTDFRQLKGPNSDLYTLAVLRGITRQKSLYKCKWFTFNYWHSTTYLGRILKSRPGIMLVCHNFNIFNSNVEIKGNIPSSMQNSSYPFKFSVYRTKMRKLLRKHFMELYLRDEQFAKTFDGFYKFSCVLFPLTDGELEDFAQHIALCLEKVSKIDLKGVKDAALKDNNKLPWHEVSKILSRNKTSTAGIVPPFIKGKKH